MDYKGVIIEESLSNKEVLDKVKIIKTKISPVVEKHKTSWLKQWTLHPIEIPKNKADNVAEKISKFLESEHPWYADYNL